MPQSLKSFLIISGFITLWAVPSAFLGASYQVALPCMSLGIFVVGMMIWVISNNENLWKQITWQDYEEDEELEPAGLVIGCLVAIPFSILLFAIASWLTSLFMP